MGQLITLKSNQLIYIRQLLIMAFIAVSIMACAPIRHTPFGEQVDTSIRNLNGASVSLLPSLPFGDETNLKFSIFTDAHANYDDLNRVVRQINQTDSQFVVNLGDMTDLGLAIEYEAFISQVKNLRKPLFSVIGNHDTIGSGKAIYQKLFGAFNYYYDFNGIRFVYFNNNALDFYAEGIDLDWLQRTVENSVHPVVLFQHVDPLNAEYFTLGQQQQILSILDPEKVLAVFHGHNHKFRTYEINDVLIQQVARAQKDQFTNVHNTSSTLEISNCSHGGPCETFLRPYGNLLK